MTTRPDPQPASGGPLQIAGGRTGVLLLILVFTYLLSAFTKGLLVSSLQVLLFLAVVLVALRNGQLPPRATRIVAICLLAGSVLAAVLQLLDSKGPGAGIANIWTALILLLAAVLTVRRVLQRPEITLQSIYGAISAYLILGLMFAAFYAAMYHFGGETFFAQRGHAGNTQLFQYFSFITLTTTGYGDYTAAASGGQAVAVIEAITGQIFLATLVARLVAGYRSAARAADHAARGPAAAPPASTPAAAPRASTPAGARRASTRRAGSSGLIGLRPPGTARRRAGRPGRPAPPGQ
jgi:voltage-gated potassium channel Kch